MSLVPEQKIPALSTASMLSGGTGDYYLYLSGKEILGLGLTRGKKT